MQSKLIQMLHSRTFGTLVVMVAYNTMAIYGLNLPPQLSTLINVVLGAVATYFHLNPSQTYTPAGTPPPAQ